MAYNNQPDWETKKNECDFEYCEREKTKTSKYCERCSTHLTYLREVFLQEMASTECCHKPGRWQYDEDEDTPCTEKLSETELTEKEYIEHPDRKIGYRPFKGHGEMERGWYCYEHREYYPTEEQIEETAEYRRNTTIKFGCGKCSKEIPHPDDPYDDEAWYAQGGVGPACPNC